MKLMNKQKLSIYKSLKLNEDFFDDEQNLGSEYSVTIDDACRI